MDIDDEYLIACQSILCNRCIFKSLKINTENRPCPTVVRLKSEYGPTFVRLQSDKSRCRYGAEWGLFWIGRARHKWLVGGWWSVAGSWWPVVGG